ncbi:MAG: hypothetical protein ACHQ2E_07245 [Gemmatimonadales bacterium]
MARSRQFLLACVAVQVGAILFLAAPAWAQQAPMTREQKIASAMTAAPAQLTSEATIMDWPASDTTQPVMLRPGTNGWVCFPDFVGTTGNDPMCLDKVWQDWMTAYMAHKPPQVPSLGVAYMIAPGGGEGSNTDPFASGPTSDNQWGHDGPHLMLLVANPRALMGLPTTRQDGEPYVMWAGTPYVHIMVPLGAK